MSARSRLEALEEQAQVRGRPGGSPQARERMVEHLGKMAALRRGELGPEEARQVEAMIAAAQGRFASRRGEGRR